MKEIEFFVQGSAHEPYCVTFILDGNNLSAFCTCPAGENGQYCKHRFAILKGEDKGVVSDNVPKVKEVAAWLPGTDVEAAMMEVAEAAHEYEC
ncbi:SWIM zinc finger [Nitrosomonas sp. Nm51]|nr:SWIM zinc finger [Nitrosomonas sp. Nm51]